MKVFYTILSLLQRLLESTPILKDPMTDLDDKKKK